MKEQLLIFIKEQDLFSSNDKILLTISGGVDSMTMLHLFKACGFSIAIAHCNFQLRGAESDGDEEFVTRAAQEYGIPIHINRFDTLKYAEENKVSIQMAARDLRYKWFDRLTKENNYTHIATAHNANDVVETMFINLTRGTGIHGLTGIRVKNKNVIRPLLFASRNEILNYVQSEGIKFREDSSNAETKYLRNTIRHNIIPLFEQLNPSFLTNVKHTANILGDAEQVFNRRIEQLKDLITEKKGDVVHLNIAAITNNKLTTPQLFEIISIYGFSYDTAVRMLKNISGLSGSSYYSSTHKIVKDRTSYILYPLTTNENEEYQISSEEAHFDGPIQLQIESIVIEKGFEVRRNREVGTFDKDKLKFPLTLRRWRKGDFFYPFGMRGKKKISDYFSDQKISIPEKENTWLLCAGEDIIWIVNHRTDNRFCITNGTKEIVQIELLS